MYSFRARVLRSSVLAPSLRERQPVNYAEAEHEDHDHAEGCCGGHASEAPARSAAAESAFRLVEEVLAFSREYHARRADNAVRLTPEERREARGPSLPAANGARRSLRLAGLTPEGKEIPKPRRSARLAAAATAAAPRAMYTL
jgi:hypothetical protein